MYHPILSRRYANYLQTVNGSTSSTLALSETSLEKKPASNDFSSSPRWTILDRVPKSAGLKCFITVRKAYSVSRRSKMDKPSTSHQSVDKVEMFEVREHVPYQAEVTRAPTYDEESGQLYQSSWDNAWASICQLYNLLHHMQIAMVVFSLWRFALNSSEGNITNIQLHIIFAGTGYQLFLVEAVLTLHRHNSWSAQLSHDAKSVIHGCLQLIGSLFVICGTFLALSEFNMQVSSAHGICGVIALAFTLLSFVSGILTLFSSKVRLMIKNGPVKIIHIAVGIFAISMGLVTMILGFNMDFFKETQGSLATALIVFVVMILMYIIIQPILNFVSTTKREL